jgi:hypothetical protein
MRHSRLVLLLRIALGGAVAASCSATYAADSHLLEFSAHPLDTRAGYANLPGRMGMPDARAPGLRLLQFSGPIQQAWLDRLAAQGVQPLRYIRNNGYLVWVGDARDVAQLANLLPRSPWLAFDAPLHGALKLDPLLDRRVNSASTGPADEVDVVVQVYAHGDDQATRELVESLAVLPVDQLGPVGGGRATSGWSPVLGFRNIDLRVRVADIPRIAQRADVSFVGERLPTRPYDEKQSLIMSGELLPGTGSQSHLQFLLDRGFPTDPTAYPVVDVTDSTVHEGGTGSGVVDTRDPMLRAQGELDGASRVAYFENCSDLVTGSVGAEDGHGTINASIVAGYDQRSGWPYRDDDGQQLGLGINPFGRVGSTAIFVGTGPGFNVFGCGGDDQGIIASNARNGAAISSNSWGSGGTGTYTTRDQVYDAAVRDVDAGGASDRGMIYIFAAGNDGPSIGTVGTPGSAKNLITVGASENLRPVDIASRCPNDSLAASSDDPMSIASFSGRGPVAGNRVKPELVAPGTRITGSRSIYPGFAGGGVCISEFPNGQTVFAASSGTSHSTPAVSGVASLAYWWIEHGGGAHAAGALDLVGGARAPSPALMKAWLLAHPTYLTGPGAGDSLPSNHQGYGMPDMAGMFDATPKVMIDQTEVLDASGEQRDYLWGVDDASAPVRVVLSWTDAPGQPGTSPQVNDLDLQVVVDGVAYRGNRFDGAWSTPGGEADDRNNYEAVFLPPGIVGDITILVDGSNIAGDGVPGMGDATDQDFALVCTNCLRVPTFTVAVEQPALQACVGARWSTAVRLDPLVGFDQPVTLSLQGAPAGIEAQFDPNPATPPSDATLALGADANIATGAWPVVIAGHATGASRTVDASLAIYEAAPTAPRDATPGDGSSDVPATPAFAWDAVDGAHTYVVEIASDPYFANVVLTHETRATAWTVAHADALDTSARYWWRVIASNACGTSIGGRADTSLFASGFETPVEVASQSFTTEVLPGDCPVDVATTVLMEDAFDDGASGWSVGARAGDSVLWTLADDPPQAGNRAWQAAAPASGASNDAWLVSPAVTVPANLASPTLAFRDRQAIKAGGAGVCYDGAIVELSNDGGANWTALSTLLTDPFDGFVNAAFGNPLAGQQAWCGDPGDARKSVIDLSAHAGETLRFRYRLGHDRFPHRRGVNWTIDDVRVAGCAR